MARVRASQGSNNKAIDKEVDSAMKASSALVQASRCSSVRGTNTSATARPMSTHGRADSDFRAKRPRSHEKSHGLRRPPALAIDREMLRPLAGDRELTIGWFTDLGEIDS